MATKKKSKSIEDIDREIIREEDYLWNEFTTLIRMSADTTNALKQMKISYYNLKKLKGSRGKG